MQSMRRLADRRGEFIAMVRESGLRHATNLAARASLPRRVVEFRRLFIVELDLRSVPRDAPDDSDIEEITADVLGTRIDPGEAEALLRGRLRAGRRLWVVTRAGRVAAYDCLGGESRAISPWLVVNAEDGGIWSEMIRVARDFRGQGLGPRLRAHVARHCARAGYARMIGFIDTTNRNSISALGKVGFVPIGRIFFVRILGLTVIHHGPTWRLGRWTADRPLEIPVGATRNHATCQARAIG